MSGVRRISTPCRSRASSAPSQYREVAVVVERSQPLDGVGGQRVVVSPRDLEQGRGADRPFEVDVKLDLWIRHSVARRVSAACQRRSSTTDSQIESSKSAKSGRTSSASETGSTVGSRIAAQSKTTYPIRRLLRSCAEVRTPSRTSPITKIGSWNTRPVAKIISATNERK